MIGRIKITGFKSILEQSIELGRLNVLIGANGSGKSNFLEAIGIASAAAYGNIDDESLQRRGVRPGVPRLYKSSFRSRRINPHITLDITSHDAEYVISLLNPLEKPKPKWSYKTERLISGSNTLISEGVRKRKSLNPEKGLAALTLVELLPQDPAYALLSHLQNYAIYCPNTAVLRGLVPDPQMRMPVGLSGGGLAEGFLNLKKSGGEDERIEEALEEILGMIDWVEDITAITSATNILSPSIPRPKRVVQFKDRFMRQKYNTLTAYDASEGALYILFISILALSKYMSTQ